MGLAPLINAAFTSATLRDLRRGFAAVPRRLGRAATLHVFHQIDDPYSHLLLLALQALEKNYHVGLRFHIVGAASDAAAPDRERLAAWARRDATELAQCPVLPAPTFCDFAQPPEPASVRRAQAACVAAIRNSAKPLDDLIAIGSACWRTERATLERYDTAGPADTEHALANAAHQREAWGHYLGAMVYFEGEWTWGIDRLHYLERRLFDAGLAHAASFAPICPPPELEFVAPIHTGKRPVLHFFCSLRSPYTYLAIDRCERLAAHYGAELRLRFVLPMVMRGLPVPLAKRLYIVRDAKREAERLGLPFGRISDPVGAPTERGLAVLHRAISVAPQTGLAFFKAFMRGVWAEGVDAGSTTGLKKLAARAGLDAGFVAEALADDGWRAVAQANREEMFAAGLWGVPSFRVNDGIARWGQDRLWRMEKDLQANS